MSETEIDYYEHYKKFHSDTAEYRQAQAGFYAYLLANHVPESRTARVLDIGCGMGFVMSALLSMGFKDVSGIDIDAGQAAACVRSNLNVSHVTDTAAFLAQRPKSYDLVVLMDVLEHIPVASQISFLKSIFESLAPGGRILLTVPNANSALAVRWRYIDWTHTSSFTEFSLEFVLHNAGFRQPKVSTMEWFSNPGRRRIPNRETLKWWRFRFFRWLRRQEMIAEIGREQAMKIPQSVNLLATAVRE